MSKNIYKFIIFALAGLCLYFSLNPQKAQSVQTIYGEVLLEEPVIRDLVASSAFQRLAKLHQYGIIKYLDNRHAECSKEYTRYLHSLGVYALLKKYGVSLEEQMAGLLHDVSHTAFSHLGDTFYGNKSHASSYQDQTHEWFLAQTDIARVLKTYGYSVADVSHMSRKATGLKQPYPDMCADRIEYNISGGLYEGLIDKSDVEPMLAHLFYEKGQWYFDDVAVGKKFARISLYLTKNIWASAWLAAVQHWAVLALRRGIELGIINEVDFRFGNDDQVWNKLTASRDVKLKKAMQGFLVYEDHFTLSDLAQAELTINSKNSCIDPLVLHNQEIVRLSALDSEFAREFQEVSREVEQTRYLRFK